MRKMKKINGFLIVRFNDREKKDYPTLGSFGVIEAEQYTGDIDIDLGVMEYDDAETIEIAVEQARGLNAEEDYSEEPATYTLIIEDSSDSTETEIEPQLLINGWETQLKTQIKSSHHKDIDPRTAAHELFGYKAALHALGLIDQDARAVDPDHFAPGMVEQPLPRDSEELVAHICDQICKYPAQAESQGKLDSMCAECVVGRLVDEAHDRDDRLIATAKKRLDGLIRDIAETQFTTEVERLEHEAWAYLEALATTKALAKQEVAVYEAAISDASKARSASKPPCAHQDDDGHHVDVLLPSPKGLAVLSPHDYVEGEIFTNCTVQMLKCRRCGHESFAWSKGALLEQKERSTFENLPQNLVKSGLVRRIYALGLALAEECPDNDCRIYFNLFNAAREIDAALDELGNIPAPALALRRALMERVGELEGLYEANPAIQQFKKEMQS